MRAIPTMNGHARVGQSGPMLPAPVRSARASIYPLGDPAQDGQDLVTPALQAIGSDALAARPVRPASGVWSPRCPPARCRSARRRPGPPPAWPRPSATHGARARRLRRRPRPHPTRPARASTTVAPSTRTSDPKATRQPCLAHLRARRPNRTARPRFRNDPRSRGQGRPRPPPTASTSAAASGCAPRTAPALRRPRPPAASVERPTDPLAPGRVEVPVAQVDRVVGPASVQLGDEGRRTLGVGEHHHLAEGPGQGDVEHAPFPLLVLAQTMGEQALGGAVDDDVFPLPALDLVDRREQHGRPAATAVAPAARAARPRTWPHRGAGAATASRATRSSVWVDRSASRRDESKTSIVSPRPTCDPDGPQDGCGRVRAGGRDGVERHRRRPTTWARPVRRGGWPGA